MAKVGRPKSGGKSYKFRYIQNLCGTVLLLDDLGPHGVSLNDGERLDLADEFSIEEVNGSHSLFRAIRKLRTESGGPWVRVFSSEEEMKSSDYKVIIPLISKDTEGTKKLREGLQPGDQIEAPANVYDDKLVKDIEKEELRDEKLKQRTKGIGKPRTRSQAKLGQLDDQGTLKTPKPKSTS